MPLQNVAGLTIKTQLKKRKSARRSTWRFHVLPSLITGVIYVNHFQIKGKCQVSVHPDWMKIPHQHTMDPLSVPQIYKSLTHMILINCIFVLFKRCVLLSDEKIKITHWLQNQGKLFIKVKLTDSYLRRFPRWKAKDECFCHVFDKGNIPQTSEFRNVIRLQYASVCTLKMSVNLSCDFIINCQPVTNYERNAATRFDTSFRLWNFKVEVYCFRAHIQSLFVSNFGSNFFHYFKSQHMKHCASSHTHIGSKQPDSSFHLISELYWQLINAFNNICIDSPLDKLQKQSISELQLPI